MIECSFERYVRRARDYESAARILIYKSKRSNLRLAPCLHLIAHGMELILKSSLVYNGIDQEEIRIKYGHDLIKLWDDKCNKHIRDALCVLESKAMRSVNASGDMAPFYDQLLNLSDLHKKTQSLRYPDEKNTTLNSPELLCEMLHLLIDNASFKLKAE